MDTRNVDIVSKYFDIVQEEIKKLISEDKEIKPGQVELFNQQIFDQPDEIQDEIRRYIDKATTNNLDIKKVAKILYDRFKLQVKNNTFNQDDVNNVPNPMLGERKFIKSFEGFFSKSAKTTLFKKDLEESEYYHMVKAFNSSPYKDELIKKTLDRINNAFDSDFKKIITNLKYLINKKFIDESVLCIARIL